VEPAVLTPRRTDAAPLSRRRRRLHHVIVLGAISVAVLAVSWRLFPGHTPRSQRLSLVLGYLSLAGILVTLAVGPLNVLRRRPNPVSSDLRRDIGLWAAATGLLHVVFSLQHHFDGDVYRYFLTTGELSRSLRHDTFGDANWIGLAATLVLLTLAAISNDRSLRALDRRWKAVQRANYALAPLAVAHTLLFWRVLDRTDAVRVAVWIVVGAVVLLQLAGVFTVSRSRRAAE
jgi:sulfoxide reductase heme-binding subunit YedZ